MAKQQAQKTISIQADSNDHKIAALAALAISIHVLEAALPSPLPGIKPGFANIIVLITLILYGLKSALWVSMLRILGSSLIIGSFLSPTFFLSLSGALASLFVIAIMIKLPIIKPGIVSLSIFAAMAHISAQFWLAWWWLVPHPGLLHLYPVLLTASFFMGTLSGLIALRLIRNIK